MSAYIRKLYNKRYYIISGIPENHKGNTTILGEFHTRRQALRHATTKGYDLIIKGTAPNGRNAA